MLKQMALVMLALSSAAFLAYACNSTSSETTERLPQLAATPSGQNSSSEAPSKITGKPIWESMSGGVEIEWTADDLFSKKGEKIERIFQPLAQRGYETFVAGLKSDDKNRNQIHNCDYRRDFEVVSVVGSLVTFGDTEYSDCGGAHPTTLMRFTAIDMARDGEVVYGQGENAMSVDLGKSGKVVKLTDYFSEADVLKALLADQVIRDALIEAGVSTPPRTLAELPEIFAKNDYELTATEWELRPDFLTQFAIHHFNGDMVAVRLNLPSNAFAYRNTQLGLMLPIPAVLRQPLALAALGQEGFLMREPPAAVRDQVTRFPFKVGERARAAPPLPEFVHLKANMLICVGTFQSS